MSKELSAKGKNWTSIFPKRILPDFCKKRDADLAIPKEKSLKQTEQNPMSAGQVKYKEQRDLFVYLYRKQSKLTYQEIANQLLDYGIDISYVQIRNICVKYGDIKEELPKLVESEQEEDILE